MVAAHGGWGAGGRWWQWWLAEKWLKSRWRVGQKLTHSRGREASVLDKLIGRTGLSEYLSGLLTRFK